MLPYLLFSVYISNTLINAQCTGSITCTSYNPSDIGSKSVSCDSSSETLVSCGIKIEPGTTYVSQGTEMTDNECIIRYDDDETAHPGETKPIPVARCCDFTECYESLFDCHVYSDKKRGSQSHTCEERARPHLLSCNIEQKYESVSNDTFSGVWFEGYDTANTQAMKLDYCRLFAEDLSDCLPTIEPSLSPVIVPTKVPTKEPTKQPTDAPIFSTELSPTQSPTLSPTPSPTIVPTQSPTLSPTPSPTGDVYVYNQSTFTVKECSLDTFADTEYLWLYSFCCSERFVPTTAPTWNTTAPTLDPTASPTTPTLSPVENVFADSSSISFSSQIIPLDSDPIPAPAPTMGFTDIGNGVMTFIHWGVSNVERSFEYVIDGDWESGIKQITDTPADKYYFTIKSYGSIYLKAEQRFEYEFVSEYGSIYLPDGNPDSEESDQFDVFHFERICEDVPEDSKNLINKIHVYVNEETSAIEGMTMFRTESDTNYTCHIAMANETIRNSAELQWQLFEKDYASYPEHSMDYRNCTDAGLAGFRGWAPLLGIKSIQFDFIGDATDEDCPGANEVTDAPTKQATLPPTPAPTAAPTTAPAVSAAAASAPTMKNTNDYNMSCYWIMAANDTQCSTDTKNPSFMTGCIGYSMTEQPNSWYIESDTCMVDARTSKNKQMAAIATCCYLKDYTAPLTVCEAAGIGWTSSESICEYGISDLVFGVALVVVVIILVIWTVFVYVYCTYSKQKEEKKAKEKRLKAAPEIHTDKDGDKVATYTKEQIQHRMELEKFKVGKDVHQSMLQDQIKLGSTNDVGLI